MRAEIKDFLTGFSGCNGGDIGSKERPAIWCCGIEWGGNDAKLSTIKDYFESGDWKFIQGFEEEGENIKAPYDKVLCKLLCAINGQAVENYAEFAKRHQVWHKGVETGYFKMNLYPLWFKDTDPTRWDNQLVKLLSFNDKNEYIRWCRLNRFPKLHQLMEKYCPKLIICFGVRYEDDFNLAFSDGYRSFKLEMIDNLPVRWKRNENSTVVAVLPFPNVQRYGLQRNRSMQQIGEFLAGLIR